MILHPHPDPVAVEIFGFGIRWYGLMYILGFLLAWKVGSRLIKTDTFAEFRRLAGNFEVDELIFRAILGVLIGGRLGYVLFYNPAYFLENPVAVLYINEGGMSFHGGLVGVIVSVWLLGRELVQRGNGAASLKTMFLYLMDFAAVITPLGLGLGRLGNFINAELPGRVAPADLPWAMSFGVPDYLPRHPSPLYQFALEGILLAALMFWMARRPRAPGWLAGIFLIGYGVGRFIVEFYREPDAQLGLLFLDLSMGQLLTVPMVLLGLFMVGIVPSFSWHRIKARFVVVTPAKTVAPAQGSGGEYDATSDEVMVEEAEEEAEEADEKEDGEEKEEEEKAKSGFGGFFRRLFSGGGEEEEDEEIYLTRREKRRQKKKKKKRRSR